MNTYLSVYNFDDPELFISKRDRNLYGTSRIKRSSSPFWIFKIWWYFACSWDSGTSFQYLTELTTNSPLTIISHSWFTAYLLTSLCPFSKTLSFSDFWIFRLPAFRSKYSDQKTLFSRLLYLEQTRSQCIFPPHPLSNLSRKAVSSLLSFQILQIGWYVQK